MQSSMGSDRYVKARAILLLNMKLEDYRYRMYRFTIQLMNEISTAWIIVMNAGVDEVLSIKAIATQIAEEISAEPQFDVLNRKRSGDLISDSSLYPSAIRYELTNFCDGIRETVRDLSKVARSRS